MFFFISPANEIIIIIIYVGYKKGFFFKYYIYINKVSFKCGMEKEIFFFQNVKPILRFSIFQPSKYPSKKECPK